MLYSVDFNYGSSTGYRVLASLFEEEEADTDTIVLDKRRARLNARYLCLLFQFL